MLKKKLLALLCAGLFTSATQAKDIKLLVLIISSDQFPVYVELQKRWKAYMHYDPAHVEAYFIRANPQLPTLTAIDGDIIWSRVTEGWTSNACIGIIDKTVLSLEAMLPRLGEFDYVLRTNLSSFYVFPKLLEVLKGMPREGLYFASSISGDSIIGSGCGFIMSRDVAKLLVQHKHEFIGATNHDDVLVGEFLYKHGIRLTRHTRIDFTSMDEWNRAKDNLPSNIFHFRVKNDDRVRLEQDVYMNKELFKRFYPYLAQ